MSIKKKIACLTIASILALSPVSVFADEKDDRIAELESQIVALEAQVADLQSQLEEASSKNPVSTDQSTYKIGDSWIVEGQWNITVNSVEETSDRNEYSEQNPAAVYIVTYTYENIGYDDDFMDGLYISLEDGIVDNTGKMGYSYPGNISMYPQETPIGASCEAQACIGVAYLIYSIVYWTGSIGSGVDTAEQIGAGIATALVMPHLVCTALAVIFNALGLFMRKRGFALTGAILYTMALVLFPIYFMFVIIEMILSYIGFAKMKKE